MLDHTFAYCSHLISMSNQWTGHIDFYLMSLIFTLCKTQEKLFLGLLLSFSIIWKEPTFVALTSATSSHTLYAAG